MEYTKSEIDEIAAAERKAYYREWRAANPDKVRAHNATYWRRRTERRLQAQQAQESAEGQAHD